MMRLQTARFPFWLTVLVLLCTCAMGAEGPEDRAEIEMKLTLKEAVSYALINSVDLRLADLDVRIQDMQVTVERAAFDPVFSMQFFWQDSLTPVTSDFFTARGSFVSTYGVTASAEKEFVTGTVLGADYQFLTVYSPDYDFLLFDPNYRATVTLRIQQPLLQSGWKRYGTSAIRIARHQKQAAQYRVRLQALTVALQVSSAYWTLVRAIQDLGATQQSLVRAEEFLRNVRQRVAAEQLARSVLPDAEANLEDRLDAVYAAGLAILNAEDELKRAMYMPGEDVLSWARIVPLDRPEMTDMKVNAVEAEQLALEYRPELHITQLEKQIARINIDRAWNEKLPRLDLTAFVRWEGLGRDSGRAHGNLIEEGSRSHGVTLNFLYPIGNRGPEARHRQSKQDYRRRRLALRRLEQQIQLEVRQTYRLMERLKRQVTAVRKIEYARSAALDRVQTRFDVGRATSLDVVTAQEDLAVAERDLIAARAAYNTAEAQVYATMGVLLKQLELASWGDNEPLQPIIDRREK